MTQKATENPMASGSHDHVGFFGRFAAMKGAAPELWITFVIKLIAIQAYAIMNWTFVLWLSADFGYSDQKASAWIAVWSTLFTFFTVLVGSLTDAIGLRRTMFLGVVVCVVSRAFLTFSSIEWVALACGLLPLAVGEALGTPVLVAAIRRYSNTAQRSLAFSFFYAMMNVGFLIAAFFFDHLRHALGERGSWTLPVLGMQLTTYRVLFLVSFLSQIILLPILYFGIREGVEVTDEGVKITREQPKYPHKSLLEAFWLTSRDALRDTVRIFTGLWHQSGFYQFLAFLTLATFMRLIFVHMHYTYPKFGIRELGPGAPVMKLWGINQILIIVLVPIVGALTVKVGAYRMVTFGSIIGAASVFIMTLPLSWFQTLADSAPSRWLAYWYLGVEGNLSPWYVVIFLYVVGLSVGETFFSPRLYEYAAAIAPKGQEASYMSLSYLPYLLAKLLVLCVSGPLLASFCPADGPRDSRTMWLIIALMTVVAPVGLLALARYIRVPEARHED